MTLVNARAAIETAIQDAVKDSDPTVTVVFDNTPFTCLLYTSDAADDP